MRGFHAPEESHLIPTVDCEERLPVVMGYRPDVDGLRAVAVISVIIYHINPQLLPGGFVGVDVFFVISGYVVTGSLLGHSCSSASDFLCGFYARRVKRLTPALVVVVLVSGLYIAIFTPPGLPHVDDYFSAGICALCGISNMFFGWLSLQGDGGYWDEMTGKDRMVANPFVHTWSLGVEEHFYLVFPLLVMVTHGRRVIASAPHRPAWPSSTIALGLCCALSAWASWSMTTRVSDLAFYTLPARFWELAAGAIVADVERSGRSSWPAAWGGAARAAAQVLAVLLMGASFWFVTPDTMGFPFPGAVFPVLGAVCFIVAGAGESRWLNRALGCALPVYVGKLSYPLYLWHWPVLTLSQDTVISDAPGLTRYGVMVSIMFGLAALTYHLIEGGFHNWRPKRHWHVFAALLPAALASAVLLFLLQGQGPLHGRLFVGGGATAGVPMDHVSIESGSNQTPSAQLPANGCACSQDQRILVHPPKARAWKPGQPACLDLSGPLETKSCWFMIEGTDNHIDKGTSHLKKCLTPTESPERMPTIFLLGDSHAIRAYTGLSVAVRGKFQICKAYVLQYYFHCLGKPYYKACATMKNIVAGFLRPGDVVVWSLYSQRPEIKNNPEFIAKYISFLQEWSTMVKLHNATMVVFGDNHGFEVHSGNKYLDPHNCIAAGLLRDEIRELCFPRSEIFGNSSLAEAVRNAQSGSDWLLYQIAPLFCAKGHCGPFIPGTDVLAYMDGHHLNAEGSAYIAPFICSFFHDHGLFGED